MTREDKSSIAGQIYSKYHTAYSGETQGCCLLIADEIQSAVGGICVAGYLTWNGGACKRSHWWVDSDGQLLDPMGDNLLSFEEFPGRTEEHRDQNAFAALLSDTEQWRIL